MAPILFVCHDTGNTNVLLTTAQAMLAKNPNEDIKFLVIGEAANHIFNHADNRSLVNQVIRLTNLIDEKDFRKINARSLTQNELDTVALALLDIKPNVVITGCSCGPEALAPFQIAELLTKLNDVDVNIIYNGDFFQDIINNPFWACLSQEWIEKISLCVAFVEAVAQVEAKNKVVKCILAGSTALDNALEIVPSLDQIKKVRNGLNVTEEQNLFFIAGSKFIKDDLKLLNELAKSIQDHPNYAVRMGMHPGTSDVDDYVSQVVAWMVEKNIENLRLVVKEHVAAKISEQLRVNTITAALAGDEIYVAASAIASSQPSTLSAQTIMRKLPAFCLSEYKGLSYLHGFFANQSEELFVVSDKKVALDKTKLGLPAGKTVDILAEALTAPRRRIGG